MQDCREAARMFKVLSVDTRIRIVQLLCERTLCVGALSARLGISAAAVSQHLRVLRDASLVEAERRGNHIHYAANVKSLGKWKSLIVEILGDATDERTGRDGAARSRRAGRTCSAGRQKACRHGAGKGKGTR
jgi:ArsR family transcriptional regulator, arsenate/arsenite/antimonite-responsive transcriptional repressor